MKRHLTLIILLLSSLPAACRATNSPQTMLETRPVATATPVPDRCSADHLTAEIVRVNKLTDEFDSYSSRASESPQSQLIQFIPELQRILRDAQDQDIPACLQPLKELQTAHMEVVVQTLIYLNGHPLSNNGPDPTVIANVNAGTAEARRLHEKYDVELSSLLDTALTAPSSDPAGIATDQPADPILLAGVLAFLISIPGFALYLLIKRARRNHGLVPDQSRLDAKRLQDVYSLTSALSSASDHRRAFQLALDISTPALTHDGDIAPAGMAMLFDDESLQNHTDIRMRLEGGNRLLQSTSDEKEEVILFKDMQLHPGPHPAAADHYKSGYSLPIRSDLNAYGILLFVHPDEHYFTADRRSILKVLGNQLTAVVENLHAVEGVEREKEYVIDAYETARRELAHKVHEGPIQTIAEMAVRLNTTKQILKRDIQAAVEEITKLEELAQSAMREIGHMPVILRPLSLETLGLTATLQAMADRMKGIYNQRVIFNVDEDVSNRFGLDEQNLIFHIIEEAVENACRHAAAEIIAIRLHQEENDLATLQIVDNGIGFDIDANIPLEEEYTRMVNLQERVKLVQGLLQVNSMPGQGTIVQVYIPFPEAPRHRQHYIQS